MVTSTSFLIISLLFPILVYFIYLVYSDLKNEKEKDYILDLTLLTSFYLAIIQGNLSIESIHLINVPLVISLIKKRKISSFLLIGLISVKYNLLIPNLNILYFVIEYLMIYILVKLIKKYEASIILIVKIIFIIVIIILGKENVFKIDVLFYILNLFVSYIIFIIFKFIYLRFELIVSLKQILKRSIEEQKKFQDLFKIAHEVKNPLSVCKGYLQMLDLDNKRKTEKFIHIINVQIDKTLEILKDFSNISQLKIIKKKINLNLLLKEISQEVSIFNTAYLKIVTEIPSENIFIEADFNRLKQVLLNVIKNSKEAIEKSGQIKISLFKKKKYAYIVVKDNGIGMDAETLKKLFSPFFTTKNNGTGLGVCLSKEIIEKHDGKIEYFSKINKGTKVIIKLLL